MKKKEPVFQNNLYILKMIHRASPGRITFSILSVILATATNFLFNVFLLRLVINSIQDGTPFRDIFGYVVGVGIVLMVYYLLNNYYTNIYLPSSNGKIYKHIQKQVFQKAESVEMACYENPAFYDTYMKAVNQTNSVANSVLSTVTGWLGNIMTILSTSMMIFLIDPIFIVFAVIPMIYSLSTGKRLNQLRHNYDMEMAEKNRERDYIKRTFYLADFSKEMRLTGMFNVLFGRFYDILTDLKNIIKKHGLKIAVVDYFNIVIQHVILFIGSIVYSTYKTVVAKTMLFGDCVIVVNNIVNTASAIQGVVWGYISMHNNSLKIQNIRSFLEYDPAIKDREDSAEVPTENKTVSFKNVSFSYTTDEKEILKNISFEVQPGEKIALVGHNGAGKTTLVKLLLRLYDPTSGSITLDGRDIKDYKVSSYRKNFGAVFQHFKVFSMSVMENVLLKGNITESERATALEGMKNSGVYDKVMSLDKKENTVLTKEFDENGTVFSGGENQKIAIARVFAKPCNFVIMDEPSSALDPIAEYQMYEAMMKACKNKSVVYISHRLSSAVLADRVCLMENGEIVESGTHTELLEKDGKYADMWRKQSEQYQKGVEVHA